MTLNTTKCSHLTPMGLKGLTDTEHIEMNTYVKWKCKSRISDTLHLPQ